MTEVALGNQLANLLMIAWLLPLLGFAIEVFGGYWGSRTSKAAAYMAVACIGIGFVCSLTALVTWGTATEWAALGAHGHGEHHDGGEHHDEEADPHRQEHPQAGEQHSLLPSGNFNIAGITTYPLFTALAVDDAGDHSKALEADADLKLPPETDADHVVETSTKIPHNHAFAGTIYQLAQFRELELSIDYYIDSLTLVMFVMVTFIATCIHIFAIGYMSDELTEEYVDHQVHTSDGEHLHRPGRFYRFFSYMSLFCFSMLGLVLAGNIFQVFIFWELVGICSYLLIGFYIERESASTAANKAFIMNRVGDFGFLIGLMIIWTSFGTFRFATQEGPLGSPEPGLFVAVRGNDGQLKVDQSKQLVYLHKADGQIAHTPSGEPVSIPYNILLVAGLGIFAGCIGKSAQFPLQTWLPDAMEGPTPVSALVHSATMVAAGVYLAGRFYPIFTPEVLLVIAYVGCVTLFLAATIAIVATDIKRVLAYSTISQLGYMMLGIGVAGWAAGLFHLITHAFFKSLMFLCSGSVIVGCHHEQEMPKMGGLWRKMPITAFTMLVGVIAISGLALFEVFGEVIAFSGYHSKDAIVATALAFSRENPVHFLLFLTPLITAGITTFYMFRLWFYTFSGKPRDQHIYDHCHESPWVMTVPLILLAVLAAGCALGGEAGPLFSLLKASEPVGASLGLHAGINGAPVLPGESAIHAVHSEAGMYALGAAFLGLVIAYLFYGSGVLNPSEVQRHFRGVYEFLVEKWQFDNLYEVMFVRPVHIVSSWCASADRIFLDGFLHRSSKTMIDVSKWDRKFDENIVDGLVNLIASSCYAFGKSLRVIQTGALRQYVMFIAVGVLTLFVLVITCFPQ